MSREQKRVAYKKGIMKTEIRQNKMAKRVDKFNNSAKCQGGRGGGGVREERERGRLAGKVPTTAKKNCKCNEGVKEGRRRRWRTSIEGKLKENL